MTKTLNFLNSVKIKCAFVLVVLFICLIFTSALSYSNAVSEDLKTSVLRLHVIPNSDSLEDQKIKLVIRDAILDYMQDKTLNITNKDEATKVLEDNLNEIISIANNILKQNAFNYTANATVGSFDFPTKHYGDISLPSGLYDGLRITLGDAQGQNWWCVMFPPLCFIDVSSGVVSEDGKEILSENLDSEEYELISNSSSDSTTIKFKIIELFQDAKVKLAKKSK